jgi:prepilin-type N-terminal cleavage/methylation domain-containing protein
MADRDAGFTLVELIAGLLVASLLIAGIVDIVRQYATTTHRVRTIALDLRSRALADGLMAQLARADPESLVVSDNEVRATIGNSSVQATLSRTREATVLSWFGPDTTRPASLPPGARFKTLRRGVVVLAMDENVPPIAMVETRRTQAFDCQFDTVSLECRR